MFRMGQTGPSPRKEIMERRLPVTCVASAKRPKYTKQKRNAMRVVELQLPLFVSFFVGEGCLLRPELKPRYFKGNRIVWQITVRDVTAAKHRNVFPEFVVKSSERFHDPEDASTFRDGYRNRI